MKRILLAILLIFVFCSTGIASIKDSPDGFRDIKWGQSPEALGKNAVCLTIDGMLSSYLRIGDELKIGDTDLKVILYFFWDNQFLMVSIYTEGKSNSHALKAAMIARYGEQYDLNADGEYIWRDNNASIEFTYEASESEATASITSTRILQAMAQQSEEAAQKGAKDF